MVLWAILHISEPLNFAPIISHKISIIDFKNKLEIFLGLISPFLFFFGFCGPLMPFLMYQFGKIKFAISIIFKANVVWYKERGIPVDVIFVRENSQEKKEEQS